jgi:succinate dehydrogenase / fumarate reductase flavoprotein subunit
VGEAEFEYHGANRLGASALMQGLADGYFILPDTIGDYLVRIAPGDGNAQALEFAQAVQDVTLRVNKLLSVRGRKTTDEFHRELGKLMWEQCGMSRSAESLKKALEAIPRLREEFWENVNVPGGHDNLNQALEHAGRVADFLEFAELMCHDALNREESCGGHFRVEHQTPDGEAKRNDEQFCYVAAWEYQGVGRSPILHKEPLQFESVQLAQRSYK